MSPPGTAVASSSCRLSLKSSLLRVTWKAGPKNRAPRRRRKASSGTRSWRTKKNKEGIFCTASQARGLHLCTPSQQHKRHLSCLTQTASACAPCTRPAAPVPQPCTLVAAIHQPAISLPLPARPDLCVQHACLPATLPPILCPAHPSPRVFFLFLHSPWSAQCASAAPPP